jgi:hypothetical protein
VIFSDDDIDAADEGRYGDQAWGARQDGVWLWRAKNRKPDFR